jgi:hypothetical protein
MTHFFESPSGSLEIKTLVVPKISMLIFFSNRAYLEHKRKISYSPQKDISNGVFHAYLTFVQKGFMVESQIGDS